MRIIDVPQRTPEWFAARLGRLTGSRAADMLATRKDGKPSAARTDLKVQLMVERMTGQLAEDEYTNAHMQRGVELEPKAITAYQELSGNAVTPVGFVQHDDLMAGCSPDGFIGKGGLLEIKCPKMATHLSYLKAGSLPAEYIAQVTHNLWICEREFCDFVSFDDRWPERYRIVHVRVHRDEKAIQAHERAARKFLEEVDLEVAGLHGFSVLEEHHTCHDMNPPFPGPCLLCEKERVTA